VIDPRHVPPALVADPAPVAMVGDVDALERYIRSGQAARHWHTMIAEHQQRLQAACTYACVSWTLLHTVWQDHPALARED
jgi:hypothetical protein